MEITLNPMLQVRWRKWGESNLCWAECVRAGVALYVDRRGEPAAAIVIFSFAVTLLRANDYEFTEEFVYPPECQDSQDR